MHEREHRQFSTFKHESKHSFTLNIIDKYHLKRIREKKKYPHCSFIGKKNFLYR